MPRRISDRATFAALARARRVRRGPLSVAVLPPDGRSSVARVAYSVGRKVGGAVVRNRVRRRLRAAVHELDALLVPGAAYLVSAGPAAAVVRYQELVAHLGEALGALAERAAAPAGDTAGGSR